MSNKIPNLKKSKVFKTKIPINRSKHNYGIYDINQSIQLPPTFGNGILVKNEPAFLPNQIVKNSDAISGGRSLEDLFIEVTPEMDLTNKKVLIIRNGGIGDILSALFGIVELKRRFKGIYIGLLTEFKNLELVSSFKGILDFASSNIIPFNSIKFFSHIVNLDDVIENNNELDIQDVFAAKMGVKIHHATKATLIKYFCRNEFTRNGIGIQYRSNSQIRNYSLEHIVELMNKLYIKYPNKPIVLLGVPNDFLHVNYIQVNCPNKIISNGCGNNTYTILQSFDIIQQLELVIACDSSMNHIAGLCNTPLIGLFGPFHSSKRISKYNNAIGINGKTNCSPCNRHDPQSFCPFTNGEGICINSIPPDLILDKVEQLMGIKNDI